VVEKAIDSDLASRSMLMAVFRAQRATSKTAASLKVNSKAAASTAPAKVNSIKSQLKPVQKPAKAARHAAARTPATAQHPAGLLAAHALVGQAKGQGRDAAHTARAQAQVLPSTLNPKPYTLNPKP